MQNKKFLHGKRKCIEFFVTANKKREKNRGKPPDVRCRNPGSNQGPLDLQSNALPTELFRLPITKSSNNDQERRERKRARERERVRERESEREKHGERERRERESESDRERERET